MTPDVRLVIRPKNARICRAMEAQGMLTVADLSRRLGIPVGGGLYYQILCLVNFRLTPIKANGDWRPCAQALADVLDVEPEDLWPEYLREIELKRPSASIDVTVEQLAAISGSEQEIINRDFVGKLLDRLPPREKLVIEMRHGLNGKGEHTLREIGEVIGVTQERVRSIESKAIGRCYRWSKGNHPMRHRKRRLARKRLRVDRAERVQPPPEAAQHYRPWPMQTLLATGPPQGIDDDEFEAALQIVETFKVLTVELGMKGLIIDAERVAGTHHGMSDRDAERIAVWFHWSARLPIGLPPRLVRQIEDDAPILSVPILRYACHQWSKVRADRANVSRETSVQRLVNLDRDPHRMLTMPSEIHSCATLKAARPVFLPLATPPQILALSATRPSEAPQAVKCAKPLQRPVNKVR